MIRRKVCQPLAPSVLRRLLLLVADLPQGRDDLAGDERERDEDRGDDHRRQREEHLDVVALEEAAEPARAPVEEEQREADDDGREREREVDERVQQALPRKPLADDRERADDPEDGVERHRDRRDDQGQLERVDRLGRRERLPGGPKPSSNVR